LKSETKIGGDELRGGAVEQGSRGTSEGFGDPT
jgi:hypothetical protein